MSNKPVQPVSEGEAELFQQAMEGVSPLPPSGRIPPALPRPRYSSTATAPAPSPLGEELSDHLTSDTPPTEYLRPGMDRGTLRKLRRGHWPIQDQLDLHGCTSDTARQLLASFLQEASRNGLRCINIVHGKGWRSEGGEGILKLRTRHWLSQHPQVLAFCEPPAQAGGGGAVWVLLRLS